MLAAKSFRELDGYIGRLVDETLALPREELEGINASDRTLMHDLALQQPERKVSSFLCCLHLLRLSCLCFTAA